MTTAADVVTAAQAACDAAESFGLANGWTGTTRVAALAAATDLQTKLDAANATIATLQGKIEAAKSAAQADKDADAANVAGQGVLDALA